MSPYLFFKKTSLFWSDANTSSLMAISRSYLALLQKKKNPEARIRKQSIPQYFGWYIHFRWRINCHRANKENYCNRMCNYYKVQLHHYQFSIPRIWFPDFCSYLSDKGTTYAIFRIRILTQFLSMQSNLQH